MARKNVVARSGRSPYQRYEKQPYRYPAWVTQRVSDRVGAPWLHPVPESIEYELNIARQKLLFDRKSG